ncbi:MAG: serine/threonine protein kinase [Deltaproteobacteria bacterium]|jgi:serine/threonine protein kinase|nr:serine/threonine protein kinase [Deltaproteobacteria bacterium]
MAQTTQDKQPRQVGQYYLMEKIAQGGMAEIFKGLSYDVHGIKKTVCIKKILPHIAASEEFIDSLIDEAKIAVKLVHGNIAQTYDLGKVADDYFMVMEYVDGKSLSQIHKRCLAKKEVIPIHHLVHFISETLNGLDYIHRRTDENGLPLHIVHRDISPQNIMVSYAGTVKIIDFGIAKTGFKVGSTDSGILKGKFAYMSPEQAHGDTIDHRSDIFSLGIILHETLTGKRLFKAGDSRETIRNVRKAKVIPPSVIRNDLPDELDRIVLKALSKDRRHRYKKAAEMHDDLIKFLYSNYPEFRPSDVGTFVQDLFKNELQNQGKNEADAKTPYLIIDRSNSALADDSQFEVTGAAKAPIDLEEFMVEEDSESVPKDMVPYSDNEMEEYRDGPEIPKESKFKYVWDIVKHIKYHLLVIFIIAIVTTLAVISNRKSEITEDNTVAYTSAEIMITTEPADASIVFNNKPIGQGSPITMRDIDPNADHLLVVQKEGFFTHEKHLNLKPGEFLSLSIALKPKPPMTSAIELTTIPEGATVFLDNRETAYRTPTNIKDIDPKRSHDIGLFLRGHRFWNKKINLKPGETKSFEIQMVKDFATLNVESEPPGALVMLDGVPIGQTPVTREKLEPDKVYKVEVWVQGYEATKKDYKAVAGVKKGLRFILKKMPTPAELEMKAREEKREMMHQEEKDDR